MKKAILAMGLLLSQMSFGSVLSNQLGTAKIENVTLSTGAAYANGQGTSSVQLGMVGAGLRKKKVLGLKLNVYVAQLFLSSPESFVHSESAALDSAASSATVAVQLTFLRTVEAAKVQSSFVDALQANGVNLQQDDVRQFLSVVANGGDAENKKTLTILIEKTRDGEVLKYEDTAGTLNVVNGHSGLGRAVLSIWLGASSDDELADCKRQIVGQ